jgi:hypothetical protein
MSQAFSGPRYNSSPIRISLSRALQVATPGWGLKPRAAQGSREAEMQAQQDRLALPKEDQEEAVHARQSSNAEYRLDSPLSSMAACTALFTF